MERINARCGFLKCGRGFVRKNKPFPGDNYDRNPTHIRDKEEGITDTRTIGYTEEIPFGAAICSYLGWGQKVFDEEKRLCDPKKLSIPFEELMIADFDGRPLCVTGDDVVDEIHDIEESLAEILEEDRFNVMPRLKPGKIRVWHYPLFKPLDKPDLFSGNHGKISTNYGEVAVFYKRRKVLPAKPEPEKKPTPKTLFPPSLPKRTGIEALGSLINAKKMPKLHQLAAMARR